MLERRITFCALTACSVLSALLLSCAQPSPIPESSTAPVSATATAGKPPQNPMIRIETDMHTARISGISADDAGQYLVTASDDKTLRVWERSTGRLLRVLRPPIGQGHEGKMYATAISPDGSTVAGAGWSGLEWDGSYSIYLFDRSSGRIFKRITGLPQSILHLAFSPDGRILLATFHGKYGVRFYRATDGKLLAEDRTYRAETYSASFDKNGRAVTASYDGWLRLYGRDFRLLAQTQIPGGKRPFSVSMTGDGSKVAVGYENAAQVDVFSGADLQHLYSPDTSHTGNGSFNAASWSADGETLYAGGQYRHTQTHLIRKWTKQGQGEWTDLAASSNTIIGIVPLSTGGIAYAASDPAFGIFDHHDARILFKDSGIPDYRDSHEQFFVSADGTTVQFSSHKDQPRTSRFSIADRLLEQNPASLRALHPPRTTAPDMVVDNWKNSGNPTLNGRPLRLKPYELSRSFVIAPDGQAMLLGTVWHLRLFDNRGRELWQVAVPANVWSVNIAENGLVATAALADGTIRWYRMSDGYELLSLFVHSDLKRWVAWTPSGYYDAGPGSEMLLGWHKNYGSDAAADFFPAAQFRTISYRPDVVKAILNTFDEQQALSRPTTSPLSVQPSDDRPLVIISPHDGATVSSTAVKVRYRVHPTKTGSADIITMINGKVIPGARGIKVTPSQTPLGVRELDLQIPEQDCEISLALADQPGSKPVSVRVKYAPSFTVKPMLYALAIEVTGPGHQQATATRAAKDAKDLAAALERQSGGLYRGVTAKVLTDGDATKDAILDGLDWLDRETTSRDIAILFIKGQAVPDRNGTAYFLSAKSAIDHLRSTALPFSDIRNVVGGLAGRAAIFIDVCQANDPRSTESCAAAVMNLGNELSSSERGVVMYSASTAQHYAEEPPTGKNGAFTTALIEGLDGKAAYGGAEHITIGMLDLYLSQRIKTLTQEQQVPMTAKSYDLPDFVLTSVHGSSQKAIVSPAAEEPPKVSTSQQAEILRRLPPIVTIVSPKDGETVSSTHLTVRYSVRTPSQEPITDIVGLVDGRPFPIPGARTVRTGDRQTDTPEIREVRLEIPERTSEISMLVKNRWASSEPSTVRVQWHRQERDTTHVPKPTLHALIIGVGRYDDPKLKLEFASKDAVDFASVLKRQQGGLYKSVVTKVLTDADATKVKILEGLEWLERETTRDDVAVVFLAGHGVNDKNGVYHFLPVNGTADKLRRTGLAFSDIKNTVASLAGKTLLFADTCHAGNIFGRRRGTVDINAVVNELTSAENGAVVFASSTGRQESLEDPAWGNGAFTKALIEALKGKAAYGGAKKITINMLDLYLSERVKELTKGQQTPTTTKPLTIQDFPIAIQIGPA